MGTGGDIENCTINTCVLIAMKAFYKERMLC